MAYSSLRFNALWFEDFDAHDRMEGLLPNQAETFPQQTSESESEECVKLEPTVMPFPEFNAELDATALLILLRECDFDEQAIIDILTQRSNAQRQEIANFYSKEFERDLIRDLKRKLGGLFKEVIVVLMTPPVEYLCQQINKALTGTSCHEMTLVEILCSCNNEEMKDINETYQRLYQRSLGNDVCTKSSKELSGFLSLVTMGARNSPMDKDPRKAKRQARLLYSAAVTSAIAGGYRTEGTYHEILGRESYAQLRLVIDEYNKMSDSTLEQVVKDKIRGSLHHAFRAIVLCAQNLQAYYAMQIHSAMAGQRTNHTALIRIIVSRSETDLCGIKREYENIYGKSLESVVEREASGFYRGCLLALIRGTSTDNSNVASESPEQSQASARADKGSELDL